MNHSSDTIGNRTRDLPTCSAVPQPTALPRAPIIDLYILIFKAKIGKRKTIDTETCGQQAFDEFKFHRACNILFLVSFPNARTSSLFQRIYHLFPCRDFALNFVEEI